MDFTVVIISLGVYVDYQLQIILFLFGIVVFACFYIPIANMRYKKIASYLMMDTVDEVQLSDYLLEDAHIQKSTSEVQFLGDSKVKTWLLELNLHRNVESYKMHLRIGLAERCDLFLADIIYESSIGHGC